MTTAIPEPDQNNVWRPLRMFEAKFEGHDGINFLWANDYPHHEGSWPYSAQAIEREMGQLRDDERARILGLNSARIFKFEVPERYQNHADARAVAQAVAAR